MSYTYKLYVHHIALLQNSEPPDAKKVEETHHDLSVSVCSWKSA